MPRKSKKDQNTEATGEGEVALPGPPQDDRGSDRHARFVHWSRDVPTKFERKVWNFLGGDANVWRFVPQQELHGYVVDFLAPEFRLIIEADGPEHIWSGEQDQKRDEALLKHGFKTLRLTPGDFVDKTPQMIVDIIEEFCHVRHDLDKG